MWMSVFACVGFFFLDLFVLFCFLSWACISLKIEMFKKK